MTALLLTAILGGATFAAVVFLVAYCYDNMWWTGRIGRALVGQGAGIALILGYASLKRLFGWPTIPWVQVGLYLVVLVIETAVAVAFVREARQMRRAKQARKKHRVGDRS